MKIDRKQIEHLATLSHLKLSEEEFLIMQKDIENILKFVEKIKDVQTDDKWEEEGVVDIEKLREDEIKPSFSSETILKNSPKKRKGYFNVPKVVE